jgi:hypothetical protein
VASGAQAWTRISAGQGATVLAVDFDLTGRREATFRDLARRLPAELTLWQSTPPRDSYWSAIPADRYLRHWGDRPGDGRQPVLAVIGYCAGSVFARAIAADLATRQDRPPALVLFDPGVPSALTLNRDFGTIVGSFTALSQDEHRSLSEDLLRLREQAGDDFDELSAGCLRLYRKAGVIAFERLGIDRDTAVELVALFGAYVSYLAAARTLHGHPGHGHPGHGHPGAPPAVVLTSREPGSAEGFAGERVGFDVARESLLDDPRAAATAARLITAGS